jgi:hypothetical protein
MRRTALALLGCVWVVGRLGATDLVLSDSGGDLGCAEVRGAHVGLVVPDKGIVLLATQSFPGGTRAGTLEGDRLVADIESFGHLELASAGSRAGTAIWGMLDRSLDVGASDGCFGFGARRFSDIDDLKTYLHWWVRQVLDRVPEPDGDLAPAVWLAGRPVSFEIQAAGHRPLEMRITEGSTSAFQPRDSERRYYFQPFVVGRAGSRALVRVSTKQSGYYTPTEVSEIAFVAIGPDEAVPIPTDPPITLRLTGIETSVSFVN